MLRFTADFAPEAYTGTVRPSMMPPAMPPGFSGVQGPDHRMLVRLYRRMRPKGTIYVVLDAGIIQLGGTARARHPPVPIEAHPLTPAAPTECQLVVPLCSQA